jgi:hypothetical protein
VWVAVLAVALAGLAHPALVHAANPPSGTMWLGAPLELHSATTTESSPEDDLFYLIFDSLTPPQNAFTMPYDGQITDIQTKGGFLTDPSGPPANPLDTMVHFQDLVDAGNGDWRVNATSGFFQMPASSDAGALANLVTDFHPENLCVHQGDVVDINTEGGFEANQTPYHDGVPLLLFDGNAGSSTAFFHGHNQTGNGATVHPAALPVTLLMRVQLAVGSDAAFECPGGSLGLPGHNGAPVIEAPTLAGLSPPVLFHTFDVAPISGSVYVRLPAGAAARAGSAGSARAGSARAGSARAGSARAGSATAAGRAAPVSELVKGQRFVALREARQIPFGSQLDTRRGRVAVVTATADSVGLPTTADFGLGVFSLLQPRAERGLVGGSLIDVPSRRICNVGKRAFAHAASHRRLSKAVLGRLETSATGKYTTSGRYSAATVRGTQWEVSDRCDGTLTRVKRGIVVVRDFRRQRNITLTAGKSYLAHAR